MQASNQAGPAALCLLAEAGNFEELNRLAHAQSCALPRFDGMTPLMCAARADGRPSDGHATCADLLLTLAEGAEDRARMTNATDWDGHACLHHAADVDNVMVAEKLLLAGACVNKLDNRGMSALAVAVQQGSARTVDLLMRAGADPELKDNELSPLRLARNGMVKRLEKWLPQHQMPTEFQVVKRSQRSNANGRFADLYDLETKPPNLGIVLRVLTRYSGDASAVLDNERRGLDALRIARHVNIAQLVKFDASGNAIEMYLEDIDGSTIEQRLSANGPFIEVVIQKYFRQFASALSYLHNHPRGPIVHRDINCRNIMLARDGTIKLIDFGFALPTGSVSSSSTQMTGTLCNIAPEIVESDESARYGRKSDIWAAGCVLYAMAVGDEPYRAASMAATVRKILGPVPQLDQRSFSTGLLQLYGACMRREPEERISAVGMALHEFLNWDARRDIDLLLVEEIRDWARHGEVAISALEDLVRNINQSYKSEVKAKVGTTTAAVVGGITAIVGFALLIPSFGAALPLAIAGTSVAIAGGVGAAAADIAGIVVQRKEFKKAQETSSEFKQLTQALVLDTLRKLTEDVQLHVLEPASAIQLLDSKYLIVHLKSEIESIRSTLDISEMTNKENLPAEQREQLKAMFDSWLSPVDDLLSRLEEPESLMSGRSVNKSASNQFNRALQKAIDFVVRVLRILMFGSVEEPSEFYIAQLKGGLRSVAGGATMGMEIGSAAGRTVMGRVIGIVGSAVFTAVDIGLLAYYSVKLHRANKDGANALKADPILCQMEVFRKLLNEVDRLEMP